MTYVPMLEVVLLKGNMIRISVMTVFMSVWQDCLFQEKNHTGNAQTTMTSDGSVINEIL